MKVSFLFTFLYRKSKTKQESLLAQDMCCQLRFVLPEAAIRGVLCKKVFLEIWQNSQENTCVRVSFLIFFFYQGFLSRTLTTHRTAGEGRGPSFIQLYLFHPLTNIQTFICNFACEILRPYRITIWLIDDVKFVLACLLDDLILGFCYSNLDMGNSWTRTRIDHHPCITSEPTNQVY